MKKNTPSLEKAKCTKKSGTNNKRAKLTCTWSATPFTHPDPPFAEESSLQPPPPNHYMICKYTHTSTHTNTQIQVHKYKYTNTNAQIQIHKYKYTKRNTQMKIYKYQNTNTKYWPEKPLSTSWSLTSGVLPHYCKMCGGNTESPKYI